MKTSVVMKRKMDGLDVLQRTGDGYFRADVLLKQWHERTGTRRDFGDFLKLKGTIDFLEVLKEDIGNIPTIVEKTDNQSFIPKRNRRGRPSKEIWVHPYLFLKLCMFVNPKFELAVIKFIYDQLIQNRHLAGDNYSSLMQEVVKLPFYDIKEVAKALNFIVFDKHYKGIRNYATQEQLELLYYVE